MSTCNMIMSTCKLFMATCEIIMLTCNFTHVNIIILHVGIIMQHADIIYLAYREKQRLVICSLRLEDGSSRTINSLGLQTDYP